VNSMLGPCGAAWPRPRLRARVGARGRGRVRGRVRVGDRGRGRGRGRARVRVGRRLAEAKAVDGARVADELLLRLGLGLG